MNQNNQLFQDKYRIPSARASWWDYSRDGFYFITIVSAKRAHLFGEIRNARLHPSPIGDIVLQEWERSFVIRRELFCDAFVLMPNHLHAILRIDNSGVDPLGKTGNERESKNTITPKSVSSFVAGFKSASTKRINEYRDTPRVPVWQTRFHDRIIRDEREYRQKCRYIRDNPAKWEADRNRKQPIFVTKPPL